MTSNSIFNPLPLFQHFNFGLDFTFSGIDFITRIRRMVQVRTSVDLVNDKWNSGYLEVKVFQLAFAWRNPRLSWCNQLIDSIELEVMNVRSRNDENFMKSWCYWTFEVTDGWKGHFCFKFGREQHSEIFLWNDS